MDTISVGIREFRAGLADYIDQRQPVAVTRHGVTVGVFVPTPRPSDADRDALREATAKLHEMLSLSDEEIERATVDFAELRKAGGSLKNRRT
jgi:antitoxin (DNA-binding transcriptional repressor) of toxin-antitoxin stability system